MSTSKANLIFELRVVDRLLAVEVGCLAADRTLWRREASRRLLEVADALTALRDQLHKVLRDLGGNPSPGDRVRAGAVISAHVLLTVWRTPSHAVLADLSAAHRVSSRARLLHAFACADDLSALGALADDLMAVNADMISAMQTALDCVAGQANPAILPLANQRGWATVSQISRSINVGIHRVTGWFSGKRHQASKERPKTAPIEEVMPINDYDLLTAGEAAAAVRRLTDNGELERVATHERRNKNRSTVADAVASHRNALVSERS